MSAMNIWASIRNSVPGVIRMSKYFVPDLQILSALKLAALRCVDVRILLPDVCLRRFYNTSRIESNSFTARR